MNRRTFLTRLFQAGAALGLAKHLPVPDSFTTVAELRDIAPPSLTDPFGMGLNKFLVTFHDGTQFSFDGYVRKQLTNTVDGLTEMNVEVQPTGEFKIEEKPVIRPRGTRARKARGTTMRVTNEQGEKDVFELKEITAPSMQHSIEVFSEATDEPLTIPGIRRMGPIVFTCDFQPGGAQWTTIK